MRTNQRWTWLSLPVLLALPALALANGFDCKDILVDGHPFNLGALGGVKQIHRLQNTPPTIHNFTFALDICAELPWDSKVDQSQQCERGARVCGQEEAWRDGKGLGVDEVVNIAGQFSHHGLHLDTTPELLDHRSSNKKREGLRLIFNGGRYPFNARNGMKQKAIIEFVCNKTVTGNEGEETPTMHRRANNSEEGGDNDDDDDDDDDDGAPSTELPHPDAGKSIQFVSFDVEDEIRTLRVTWQTKYACYNSTETDDDPKEPSKPRGGWGFFTWFIIIVFLLAAAYIIFGSWLNYNRYGARGWDLIPHGDTIRDLPYILKDFFSSLAGRFQGGGSRGGYSAV